MHQIQFREIVRDAEVAYAIHPIVRKYFLTVERLDMTAASLTERKSVPKRESAPAVEAAIAVDRSVSKNN